MESGWPWVMRILREETDVTQEEFAHIAGLAVGSVSRWERGLGKPSNLCKSVIGKYYLQNKDNIAEGYRNQIEAFFKKEKVRDFWFPAPLFPP